MLDTKYLDKARKIKRNNNIKAPINDIIGCFSDIKETGVNDECATKMLISIFNNKKNKMYRNTRREPEDKEILVYNISDDLLDRIENPE
jgi:hypothetical protein